MTQKGLAGHKARKRFGQNFLHDEHWIGRIARTIDATPADTVVEIGPGQAALTRKMIEQAGHVTAVEIDRDLAEWLRETFPETLTLIEADALKLDWQTVYPDKRIRIIGNLPYNISSPLLFHLMAVDDRVIDQPFMLQKEVVDRMVAAPGSKVYGRLSVMLQYRYRMQKMFDVPPGAFTPAPKVTSSIVRMIPKKTEDLLPVNYQAFSDVVAAAFNQRRKTLRNAISSFLTEEDIRNCEVDPGARAEALGVEAFVRLANAVAQKSDGGMERPVSGALALS